MATITSIMAIATMNGVKLSTAWNRVVRAGIPVVRGAKYRGHSRVRFGVAAEHLAEAHAVVRTVRRGTRKSQAPEQISRVEADQMLHEAARSVAAAQRRDALRQTKGSAAPGSLDAAVTILRKLGKVRITIEVQS